MVQARQRGATAQKSQRLKYGQAVGVAAAAGTVVNGSQRGYRQPVRGSRVGRSR